MVFVSFGYDGGELKINGVQADAKDDVSIICPYVSHAGLESLSAALPGQLIERANCKWIVGIDSGLTEPSALCSIMQKYTNRSFLFLPSKRIVASSLESRPRLHAKVVAVTRAGSGQVSHLVVGSANITRAAIGPLASNYEAVATIADASRVISRDFFAWQKSVLSQCVPLTNARIRQYAKVRDGFLRQNRAIYSLLDPPAPKNIRDARCLWMECGQMSGPPGHRHQIEFSSELAAYFGAHDRDTTVRIKLQGGVWQLRPLSYRNEHHYVPIWRLGLLTRRMGGPVYQGRVIHFERDLNDERSFVIDVQDYGHSSVEQWMVASNSRGVVGHTRSGADGRCYGVYS